MHLRHHLTPLRRGARRSRPKLRAERGAALVEAALVLPIFFALVLGMFTFGDAYFTRISIEDAVRDGARFAATNQEFFDSESDPTFDTDPEKTVKARLLQLAGEDIDEVCVELVAFPDPDANGACGVEDPAGATSGDWIVKVSASTPKHIEVIFFSRDITLSAQAAATYERGTP